MPVTTNSQVTGAGVYGADADAVKALVSGGGSSSTPIVLANNKFIVLGDSRTAASTDPATAYSPQRTTGSGYLGPLQRALEWRAELVGNYGINTDTIQGLITRETAQGIATGSSPTWRAEFMTTWTPATCAAVVVLIGVNNTTETIGTFGPRYDQLFGDLINAGFVVFICNELPNTNSSGQGAANFARRQYLDNWPSSSPNLSSTQKATYAAKRVIINTYDAMWAGAAVGSGYDFKSGLLIPGAGSNTLHPALAGNQVLGAAIAAGMAPYYSNFVGLYAPDSAGQSGWLQAYDMAGTTGTPGTGFTGSLADSWTSAISSAATSAGFTASLSKSTHPVTGQTEQVIALAGTGNVAGAIWNVSLNRLSGTNVGSVVDGQRVRPVMRIRIDPGHTGLMGIGCSLQVSGTGITSIINYMGYQASSGFWADTMGGFKKDGVDDLFTCAPITLPTGWNSATSRNFSTSPTCWFDGTGTVPVSATIRVSQVGVNAA